MIPGKTILIMHVASDVPPMFIHHASRSDIGTVIVVDEKKDPFEKEPIKITRPYHDFVLPEIEYCDIPMAQKKSRHGGNNRKGHIRKKKHKRKLRFK